MTAAILRAQWLSMRAFRLGSSRRGAALAAGIACAWYGFWAMLGFGAAEYLADPETRVSALLPGGLLLVFLYWQLAPLVSASLGSSLDLRKLLVYPVPHRLLFRVEVLLRLTNCSEMLLVLAGVIAGLLRNPAYGGWRAAPRLLAGGVVFVSVNLLLAAGTRNLLERLLARKHIREALVLLMVLATGLPRLLLAMDAPLRRWERLFTAWQPFLSPWAAAARFLLGESWQAAAAVLAGWTGLAWTFGRWQFERSLRYDARAVQAEAPAPGERSWLESLYRLPSMVLRDPLAAIVEKELRALSRTPRFRLVFVMGFSFGVLVWLPLAMGRHGEPQSQLGQNFLALVSLYALMLLGQVSYWNAFGFDRSAAQVYFSVPVPIARTLAGKNLAAAIFILLEIALVTAACLLLRMRIPAERIVEAFLVTPVAALYLLAIGNLSSVHYPRPMTPERVSQGASAGRLQSLVFLFFPVALLPIFLAYLARFVFESEAIFYGIVAFAAVLGCVVYRIAMESAVAAASRRREILLAELNVGEGPIVSE
jgi:ABC-2 type transport system permease protein